uniref:Secreted protein n=1 Tax=Globodera pallida TaxID=36090 RepID=A0A183BWG1_GLOPA
MNLSKMLLLVIVVSTILTKTVLSGYVPPQPPNYPPSARPNPTNQPYILSSVNEKSTILNNQLISILTRANLHSKARSAIRILAK